MALLNIPSSWLYFRGRGVLLGVVLTGSVDLRSIVCFVSGVVVGLGFFRASNSALIVARPRRVETEFGDCFTGVFNGVSSAPDGGLMDSVSSSCTASGTSEVSGFTSVVALVLAICTWMLQKTLQLSVLLAISFSSRKQVFRKRRSGSWLDLSN